MNRKIPDDAFQQYVAMGPERSYQALANRFKCSKRAVARCATRERWTQRIKDIEREAQREADAQLVDAMREMHGRHLKTIKAIQGKAVEALRSMPLDSGMEAVRALEAAIKLERLITGEASNADLVEEVTRREVRDWTRPADGET